MALETNKQYDKIVGTIMQNILAESNIAGGKIVLWDFQPDNAMDRLYYHVACIISDIYDKQIYLEMKLWDYLKFWKANRKRRNLNWVWRKHTNLPEESKTSVYILMEFVRDYYQIPVEIFDEINKEYYENTNC